MKKFLQIVIIFFTSFSFAQDCSDLFISEYVEGPANDNGLEIYNPTLSKHLLEIDDYEICNLNTDKVISITELNESDLLEDYAFPPLSYLYDKVLFFLINHKLLILSYALILMGCWLSH